MPKKSNFDFSGFDFDSFDPGMGADFHQTIPMEPTKGGFKPKKKSKGKAWGHYLFLPVEWFTKSAKWMMNPSAKGGGHYVLKLAAGLCLCFSIENTYVLFAGDNAVRFIPSAGENSGKLSRLIPLGDIGNAGLGALTDAANLVGAGITQKHQPFSKADLIVWQDDRFLVALALTLLINTVEALVLRRVRLEQKIDQLNKSKQQDKKIGGAIQSFSDMESEYKSLETIKTEKQIQSFGFGRLFTLATALVSCWGFEGYAFLTTATPGMHPIISIILALISIFGAETLWSVSEYVEEREIEEKKPTK